MSGLRAAARKGLFALCVIPAAVPATSPLARIDLTTTAGVAAVTGSWRYHDAELVATRFPAPGQDGQPTGPLQDTLAVEPQAGRRGFDDHDWPVIAPESLAERRGRGRVSFNWYRFTGTWPEHIDGRPLAGSAISFGVTVDDYAEVWVNGELAYRPAQRGSGVVAGWNAPNTVTVIEHAEPGQTFELAVFGINGPISRAPTNYIYIRDAWFDVNPPLPVPHAVEPSEVNVDVERFAPALDRIVSRNPKLYKIAQGFKFTEGPVWRRDHLLFSDPNANRIYAWDPQRGVRVFREHSGYDGADVARYPQPGSNGLALDPVGRLTVNEHGNRRITRTEPDGHLTVLAAKVDGKRLNSPNDLVYRADGTLYFTDPTFGLPGFDHDPARELPVAGIYRVVDGRTELLADDLRGPNGIAFSPDEKFLYVGDWDTARKVVMRYPVLADGRLGKGTVFQDLTTAPGEDAIDGIKVDTAGDVFVSGPGGMWILDADGHRLGLVRAPRQVHNMAWGDDGRTLYLAAHDHLYRMPLMVAGAPTVPGARP